MQCEINNYRGEEERLLDDFVSEGRTKGTPIPLLV